MKSSLFLFLSLILLCSCVEEEEFPLENDITVLTEATFDKALEKYEHIKINVDNMNYVTDVQEELEVADKDQPIFDGKGRKVPYWRIVTEQGCLGEIPHYSREEHKALLAAEGHHLVENGSRLTVENYQDKLILKRLVLK